MSEAFAEQPEGGTNGIEAKLLARDPKAAGGSGRLLSVGRQRW
ncbi:hypothetical protein [Streptomyces sp. XY413]|nr:hypothetical protein [Streptomyces sp. XY413]